MKTKHPKTVQRAKARKIHKQHQIALDACRGMKAVMGYLVRFDRETQRRIIGAAHALLAP